MSRVRGKKSHSLECSISTCPVPLKVSLAGLSQYSPQPPDLVLPDFFPVPLSSGRTPHCQDPVSWLSDMPPVPRAAYSATRTASRNSHKQWSSCLGKAFPLSPEWSALCRTPFSRRRGSPDCS